MRYIVSFSSRLIIYSRYKVYYQHMSEGWRESLPCTGTWNQVRYRSHEDLTLPCTYVKTFLPVIYYIKIKTIPVSQFCTLVPGSPSLLVYCMDVAKYVMMIQQKNQKTSPPAITARPKKTTAWQTVPANLIILVRVFKKNHGGPSADLQNFKAALLERVIT